MQQKDVAEHVEKIDTARPQDHDELLRFMSIKACPVFLGELVPGYVVSMEFIDDDRFETSREAYVIALMLERMYPTERGQRQ